MPRNQLIKTISLAAASVAAALVFGLLLKSFISSGSFGSLLIAAGASVIFMAVFLIQCLLLDNFSTNLGIIAVDAILITLAFASSVSIAILVATAALIGLLLAAYYNAQLELKNNLDIRFFKISANVMQLASSGLAIFGIVTYLSLLNLQDPIAARKALTVIIKPAEPITAAYVPGFTINNSLIQVAAKIMPPDVRLASESVQQEFIAQSSARLSAVIGRFTRTIIKPTDSILDIFYKATVAKLLKLSPTVQTLILLSAGLIAFFFMKFFLIFVNWAATLLAFGIYQLLWGAGFFKIEMQSKAKKVIVLGESALQQ